MQATWHGQKKKEAREKRKKKIKWFFGSYRQDYSKMRKVERIRIANTFLKYSGSNQSTQFQDMKIRVIKIKTVQCWWKDRQLINGTE